MNLRKQTNQKTISFVKLHTFLLSVILSLLSGIEIHSQTFNKQTDLLLANFDLKPDEDDVMAAAALACMLKHPDFEDVNYYAVAGAYGDQNHLFITAGVPDYYNVLFGAENSNWTNAHEYWDASVTRVKDKIIPILNSGGHVFVQEAGQSNFTYDVLQAVLAEGISLDTFEKQVIIVQHSRYNENNTTPSELEWLKAHTVYKKIDDGNTDDNDTPGYRTKDSIWLERAKSVNNPNAEARDIWTEADKICDAWEGEWTNKWIASGGIDFSDCVENWYIFDLGNQADDIASFWNQYVTNP
ncbi:hypothetical protein [Formosa algae]|uniref:Uncharacterized protein n=2 Tax=Formosa algae TaxID=225843 RepID=A0A9X1CBI6_9FLAO|nr:hypothetical protein [Formosa algae]MBP1840077.1 hypothetical protein [Formosa algae]MDQ0335677.1 hypothetical protein [Formosa algae]